MLFYKKKDELNEFSAQATPGVRLNNRIIIVIVIFLLTSFLIGILLVFFSKSKSIDVDHNYTQPLITQSIATGIVTPVSAVNYDLNVISFFKGYSLELMHKNDMIKVFKNQGIFGNNKITPGKPIESIQITIRDSRTARQPNFRDNGYLFLSPGFISIDYYMTEDDIKKTNAANILLSQFVSDVIKTSYSQLSNQDLADLIDKTNIQILELHDFYFIFKKIN